MTSHRLYLNQLRSDSLIVQWLLERFDLEISDFGIGPQSEVDSDNKELDFLLELSRVYDDPTCFDPCRFDRSHISHILLYLRRTHVFYLDRKLNEIEVMLDHWAKTDPNIGVSLFQGFFTNYRKKLEAHIEEEETVLFPYVEALIKIKNGSDPNDELHFTSKVSLIKFLMKHDHEIENDLTSFVQVLNNYKGTFSDNLAYRNLGNQIKSLEVDLTIHGMIEEEVLIPKAAKLEEEVLVQIS